MERVPYNKLVRDKIPENISAKGTKLETRELSEDEFLLELKKKLKEEAIEVSEAKSREALVSELADVIDVVEEIKKAENITDTEIGNARKISFEKKGGFSTKTYLEWAEDDGYEKGKEK